MDTEIDLQGEHPSASMASDEGFRLWLVENADCLPKENPLAISAAVSGLDNTLFEILKDKYWNDYIDEIAYSFDVKMADFSEYKNL